MYNTICLIGNGVLAKDCCKYLAAKHDDIRFFDANDEPSWYLEKQCSGFDNVGYRHLKKDEMFDEITKISGSVLIISAVNPYIIPAKIVDSERFTAINLHHSFLPLHPGRNAEAWTIYEEDEFAGITWHFITNDVDAGDIIAQGKIELNDGITSWKLLKLQNKLALDEFVKFSEELLNGSLTGRKQDMSGFAEERCKLHYSTEKPNDGILDPGWPAHRISAFLRAMDYGPSEVMGYPRILWKEKYADIRKYTIKEANGSEDTFTENEGVIRIVRDGIEIDLKTTLLSAD